MIISEIMKEFAFRTKEGPLWGKMKNLLNEEL
jgi:hypothetical protein